MVSLSALFPCSFESALRLLIVESSDITPIFSSVRLYQIHHYLVLLFSPGVLFVLHFNNEICYNFEKIIYLPI